MSQATLCRNLGGKEREGVLVGHYGINNTLQYSNMAEGLVNSSCAVIYPLWDSFLNC